MQIAVISDTHMNQPPGWFLRFYDDHLAGADALVHCGDITGRAVWSHLMQHPAFFCARGNCDWDTAFDGVLDDFVKAEFSGTQAYGDPGAASFSLAACHGWGPRPAVPANVAAHFGSGWDLVCFGHTHARYFSEEHGPLLLNPGSLGEFGSWAMVTLEAGRAPACEFFTVQGRR